MIKSFEHAARVTRAMVARNGHHRYTPSAVRRWAKAAHSNGKYTDWHEVDSLIADVHRAAGLPRS